MNRIDSSKEIIFNLIRVCCGIKRNEYRIIRKYELKYSGICRIVVAAVADGPHTTKLIFPCGAG